MSQYKVESRYDGPASDVNAPIIETTLKSLEKFFFFISNNRNPPITDKIVGPLEWESTVYLIHHTFNCFVISLI